MLDATAETTKTASSKLQNYSPKITILTELMTHERFILM